MKKTLFIALIISAFLTARADEGMWLLTMLGKIQPQMQQKGLKLTSEQLYNVNAASLKDAIVSMGGFCTGEIVSDKSLMLTNHHCGYGQIQAHSTVTNDFLEDGFWAQSFEEELPNPGLFVRFLVKMEDVTEKVLKGITDKTKDTERDDIIKNNSEKIQKEAISKYPSNNGFEAMVRPFFDENQYILIIYQKYTDVRLVGAPPSSVGKFGGDTDNWMWTRHTGDFSIFRVYAAPDGTPANYSANNVPLKAKYFLNVSLKGTKEGDFAMILGYPGRTTRYATSYEVEETMNIINESRVKIRTIRQDILKEDMQADRQINIKYASKYARSSNYWKYSIGQNLQLKNLKVVDKKKNLENEFVRWYSQNKDLSERYQNVLPSLDRIYKQRQDIVLANNYIIECFFSGTEFVPLAQSFKKLYDALKQNNKEEIENQKNNLQKYISKFFKDYNAPTDKKSSLAMLQLFYKDIDVKYRPEFINNLLAKFGSFELFINEVFASSIFVDEMKLNNFLKNPTLELLDKDLGYAYSLSINEKYDQIQSMIEPLKLELRKNKRLWLEGIMKMQTDKIFYPDANSTMRLTYGTIGGYSPKDGLYYKYYTTSKGILEKENLESYEFKIKDNLKNLLLNKNFGQYADKDGNLHVCFLTTNDITGGNSGSPVINGNGELIGIAFDGNWEAMSGDIAFEPELQRTIVVDIRYVLFIVDKVGNCQRLIDEMNIIK